jgi:hypothetical protein
VVGQLERLFENWDQRDLSAERYAILFLEGLNLEVRLARRLVSVPVLAVLGVAEEGTKVRVSVRFGASEATSHCAGILIDPQEAGLPSDRQRADGLAVPKAYEAFVAKGTRLSAAVASSLGEAPTELAAVRLLGGWSLSARLGSGRATVIVRCLP